MSSEEIIGYVARAIREALQKYDKDRVAPLEEKIDKLSKTITVLNERIIALTERARFYSQFEEYAIYNATRAVAEANVKSAVKEALEEVGVEVDTARIVRAVVSALDDRLRSLEDAREFTRRALSLLSSGKLMMNLPKNVEERIETLENTIEYLSDKVENMTRVIEGLRDTLKGVSQVLTDLSSKIPKQEEAINSILRRIGALEESVGKIEEFLGELK